MDNHVYDFFESQLYEFVIHHKEFTLPKNNIIHCVNNKALFRLLSTEIEIKRTISNGLNCSENFLLH